MIDLALNYKDALIALYRKTWFNDKYKFYNAGRNCYELELADNTESVREFVSLDKNGNIIGIISYSIDNSANIVTNLAIVNFTDGDSSTFSADFLQVFRDIFDKFHFHKASFYVIVGNSTEPKYDKIIEMLGGRICGYKKDDVKLYDNKYYDCKLYEILESDYMERKKRNGSIRCIESS